MPEMAEWIVVLHDIYGLLDCVLMLIFDVMFNC